MKVQRPVWVGFLITLACIWAISAAYNFYLVPNNGMHGFGRFPISARVEFRNFLTSHGFTQNSSLESNQTQTVENFCGSYKDSRPFDVTILTEHTNKPGISVELSWNYRGERGHSSDKAEEFAKILEERLETERINSLPK